MPSGAAYRFDIATDPAGSLGPSNGDANLNSLEMGGNVYRTPGQALQINVSPLVLLSRLGTAPAIISYAGASGQAVTANQTTYVWLDSAGALQTSTSSFPDFAATPHYRLATVVAGVSEISSITDARPRMSMVEPTPRLANYTVAGLPTSFGIGSVAFATDGRKDGEGAGNGTGVLTYWDGSAWRRTADDTTVQA